MKRKHKRGLLLLAVSPAMIGTLVWMVFSRTKPDSDYRLAGFDVAQASFAAPAEWNRVLKTSPLPHLLMEHENSGVRKYVYSTADCGIVRHGYRNRIDLFVVLDSAGKIEDVILDRSLETPAVIEQMREAGFFRQWRGRDRAENIRNVTGATYSCKAITESVSELLEKIGG